MPQIILRMIAALNFEAMLTIAGKTVRYLPGAERHVTLATR
jgi:hypothetical protein